MQIQPYVPHLYVAHFAGRVAKVGRSQSVLSRLRQIKYEGVHRGLTMVDAVVFGPVPADLRGARAETEVLRRCSAVFGLLPRTREWFFDADADQVNAICERVVAEIVARLK